MNLSVWFCCLGCTCFAGPGAGVSNCGLMSLSPSECFVEVLPRSVRVGLGLRVHGVLPRAIEHMLDLVLWTLISATFLRVCTV